MDIHYAEDLSYVYICIVVICVAFYCVYSNHDDVKSRCFPSIVQLLLFGNRAAGIVMPMYLPCTDKSSPMSAFSNKASVYAHCFLVEILSIPYNLIIYLGLVEQILFIPFNSFIYLGLVRF